jgi:DNA-binding winged helix-turn-helix (wHTH) protein
LEQIAMRFHIGSLQFDPDSGEIQVGDQLRRLAPQPAAVFRLLLERQGEMVPRGDFTAAIWPGEEFGVSERLTYCLHQLRRTLAELGMPSAIETVPRRGYRYRIEATAVTAEVIQMHGVVEEATNPSGGRVWRPAIAAGLAALILLAIGLRSDRRIAADAPTVTAVNAPGGTHAERHAARHHAQHVVP